MAQFDVYERRGGSGFLLDCQSYALEGLNTRFVVPLLPHAIVPSLIGHLNPVFEIGQIKVVLMPQNAATVPRRELKRVSASLAAERYVIMNALDMLLTGY